MSDSSELDMHNEQARQGQFAFGCHRLRIAHLEQVFAKSDGMALFKLFRPFWSDERCTLPEYPIRYINRLNVEWTDL